MEEMDGDDTLKKVIAVLMAKFDVWDVTLTKEDLQAMAEKFNGHALRIRGTPDALRICIVAGTDANLIN